VLNGTTVHRPSLLLNCGDITIANLLFTISGEMNPEL
jgi:hypothetical protein